MKGVHVKKIKLVSDDERRNIYEIINGDLAIKNLKILTIKKGTQLLGNHWHPVACELMYIVKGSAQYKMKNIDTLEEEEYTLAEGDVVLRTNRITHAGYFTEDSVVIDGSTETYISPDFNDVKEVIL